MISITKWPKGFSPERIDLEKILKHLIDQRVLLLVSGLSDKDSMIRRIRRHISELNEGSRRHEQAQTLVGLEIYGTDNLGSFYGCGL